MEHWSEVREKGYGYWQLALMLKARRLLGRRGMAFILRFVVFIFFLHSPAARRASARFLTRAARAAGLPGIGRGDVFRHFLCFSIALVDKMDAWSGAIALDALEIAEGDYGLLVEDLRRGEGAVLLGSHLGNADLLRALASLRVEDEIPGFSFTAIVDFSRTPRFNRLMAEIDPRSRSHLVSAAEMGPDTVIGLKSGVEAGGVLVISGDRVAASNRDFKASIPFLGEAASFPLGPFVLADLMSAPVFVIHALRDPGRDQDAKYKFHVKRLRSAGGGSRRDRGERALALAIEFAKELEALCIEHPLQWYNFYDFWGDETAEPNGEKSR
jgi:predicted LPLAT superfamily acyltransferase